ncbi:MAG TPA: hypothetical protein VHJ69_10955 [Gemmatimonadales bacterium]|jgi:hypothetical protein|nr:hypothetical protein [Gemmatimonadales bacterium]
MITTLAFRHLRVKPLRSVFLLVGFSLGVGVMVVLLSVGEAMLDQARDVSLVGGGEVTVLPEGIDVEAMRSGGVSGMFFGIDRARYLTRVIFGGPRHRDIVRVVAPGIENEVLYLATTRGDTVAVRAGGEIPSRAGAVGAGLELRAGEWQDSPADSAWVAPTVQQLYDELDRFHIPPVRDSTWGEWHYFNVTASRAEWWYLSYLLGGEVPDGRWGGQVLLTHRGPDGRYERYTANVPAERIRFDTSRADLTLGESRVEQRDGEYRLRARARGPAGEAKLDVVVRPLPRRYFPPAELRADEFVSGYVVPGLAARAKGRLCAGSRCVEVRDVPAYHDHNWGVWRDVTWEWGAASGTWVSLLYGGVYTPDRAPAETPFFVTLVDSLGARQVLRFRQISYQGSRRAGGGLGVSAPERFELVATRDADTARLRVEVTDAQATRMAAAGLSRYFLQMRGEWRLAGRVAGEAVSDSGAGFFETFVGAAGGSRQESKRQASRAAP